MQEIYMLLADSCCGSCVEKETRLVFSPKRSSKQLFQKKFAGERNLGNRAIYAEIVKLRKIHVAILYLTKKGCERKENELVRHVGGQAVSAKQAYQRIVEVFGRALEMLCRSNP